MRKFILSACLVLVAQPAVGGPGTATGEERESFFERKIRPVLSGTCFRCHGGERTGGKLRVDSAGALLKGGASGPAVVPGKPDESLLIQAIRNEDDAPHMPPGKPVASEVIRDFEVWVREGATWPAALSQGFTHRKHWAFEPPRSRLPAGSAENPVDRFIDAALEAQKLRPTDPADKRTLLRRATFDLSGLPPTPEEVATFLADDSPEAFARVVDRLLASPHYGERWGRHWLDVVRYADTAGETADYPVPQAWRYRDYVIQAFNRDKPYDEFLREQIAGDILAAKLPEPISRERYAEYVIATGYLGIARRFGFDVTKDQYLTIEDTIDVLGKSILGLTIACARCHDHKYDPIGQADYYALYGIFDSTRFPFPGCEKDRAPRDLVPLSTPAERASRIAELDRAVARTEESKTAADRALAAAVRPPQVVVVGEIPNGGDQAFSGALGAAALASLSVKRGEMLSLAVLPRNGHGADSTLIELEVRALDEPCHVWNARADLLAAAAQSTPESGIERSGVWHVFDSASAPAALTELVRDAHQVPGLVVWRGKEDTPALCLNTA
ncbi:MAG: DUF1549 domain-containing protein, partial [Isosphaeraceae bacterium]|nr:DUF1549 domain-containing protein [Isosphaeraceae bacterium]